MKEHPDYDSLVRALTRDLECIYYVDAESGDYLAFPTGGAYGSLGPAPSGTGFFEECARNAEKLVFEEDREKVAAALRRETLLGVLSQRPAFLMDYRLLIGGEPRYYRMKAIRDEGAEGNRLIIGVSDVNDQITEEQRREAEELRALRIARDLAVRDPLTGVKSKHAFAEAEAQWDERLAAGEAEPFAVAFCDVNELKEINDTQGHSAGDRHLKKAASIICDTFKHSPVYRIGGDEFVAILGSADYAKRAELVERLQRDSERALLADGVVIACGLAELDPERDTAFTQVFDRADAAMYVNKARLKTGER